MAVLSGARTVPSAMTVLLSICFLLLFNHFWQGEGPTRSTSLVQRDVVLTDDTTLASANDSRLAKRDDYSCGPGKPCSNGACCGSGGYCGYGSTYCGAGCVSNCGAVAECGKDAKPAGKTCPLNTCCSQYGFCGTTKDFCTNKCQSNCVLSPSPPGGSAKGQALSKIVGYYESWGDRLACHQVAPGDLPLNALTHLNYAFAYINPSSYELVTMDPQTPAQLFQTTADVKKFNPDLKIFISVGGWTFSDNGTATQPVFGNIAASAANRQTFANNVVKFMEHYGFDGIDIDWEYPGAPDRGGHPDDTKNFVSLLQTLRSTFDNSPRKLGITFTVPSSYWYLRWFDLPNLIKYADWINLMSYDLHGVWDRNNPIGSIVQGHTNLTEIKLAAELLWRVKVPPEKVVLGFGFYGRSFQLSNPSCSTPGCQFSGGAKPGPCSATSGILEYYEIMALLKQHPTLKPVHDQTAAVNYLTFDSNQWVSYDDAVTFKQKVDWANSVGMGGALVWAADTDDDQYSAMAGLTGKSVAHVNLAQKDLSANTLTIAQNLIGQNGQDCKLDPGNSGCVNPDIIRCPNGMKKIGWERGNCGKGYGRLICCPSATAPSSCTWRGGGLDCNGQCHPGEVNIMGSEWGGGFDAQSSPNSKCNRGIKVFCCDAGDWKDVIGGCHWTKCGDSCSSTETSVSSAHSVNGDLCTIFHPNKQYCCPSNTPLYECHWIGAFGDCANAKCNSEEVTIANDPQGDVIWSCSWGRQRTDCCKVKKPPPPILQCKTTLCDLDPGACQISAIDAYGSVSKREDAGESIIVKRGSPNNYKWTLFASSLQIIMRSRRYPTPAQHMANVRRQLNGIYQQFFRQRSLRCSNIRTTAQPFPDLNTPPSDGQVEHPVPQLMVGRFAATANYGRLPNQRGDPAGPPTRNARIANDFWQNVWQNAAGLPAGLPPVTPASGDLRRPYDRIYEALGSTTNPSHFTMLQDAVNAAKGRIENFVSPMDPRRVRNYAAAGAAGDEPSIEAFMAPLRETVGVFDYVRNDAIVTRMDQIASAVRNELAVIERNTQGANGLTAHWDQFYPYYLQQVSEFARTYVANQIRVIRQEFAARDSPYRDSVLTELLEIENKIPDMKYAFE